MLGTKRLFVGVSRKPLFKKLSTGLTLIELMVATVIMMLVLSAVLISVSSSTKASSFQRNYSQVMENGQTALRFLTQGIRNAGYQELIEVPLFLRPRFGQYILGCRGDISTEEGTVDAWGATCATDTDAARGASRGIGESSTGNTYVGNANGTGDVSVSDAIAVRYQGGDQLKSAPGQTDGAIALIAQDCTGNEVTGTDNEFDRGDGEKVMIVDNRFFIKDGNLMCYGNGKNDAVTLVSGVEQMRFWYGVSERGTEDMQNGLKVVVPQVKQYMSVTDFNNKYKASEGNFRWDLVTSVRVCVVAQSDKGIVPADAEYVDCDGNTQQMGNILRQTMYTTVDIPNTGYGL